MDYLSFLCNRWGLGRGFICSWIRQDISGFLYNVLSSLPLTKSCIWVRWTAALAFIDGWVGCRSRCDCYPVCLFFSFLKGMKEKENAFCHLQAWPIKLQAISLPASQTTGDLCFSQSDLPLKLHFNSHRELVNCRLVAAKICSFTPDVSLLVERGNITFYSGSYVLWSLVKPPPPGKGNNLEINTQANKTKHNPFISLILQGQPYILCHG